MLYRLTSLSLPLLRKRKLKSLFNQAYSVRRKTIKKARQQRIGKLEQRWARAMDSERSVIAFENFSLFPRGRRKTPLQLPKLRGSYEKRPWWPVNKWNRTFTATSSTWSLRFRCTDITYIVHTRSDKKRSRNSNGYPSLVSVRAESTHKKETGYRIKAIPVPRRVISIPRLFQNNIWRATVHALGESFNIFHLWFSIYGLNLFYMVWFHSINT